MVVGGGIRVGTLAAITALFGILFTPSQVTFMASDGPETKTIFPTSDSGISYFCRPWVKVNRQNPGEVFMFAKHRLMKSTDAGQTWFQIGDGLPDSQSVSEGFFGPDSLSFSPPDPLNPAAPPSLLLGAGQMGSWSGVPYRSDDGGLTWHPLNICEHGPCKERQNFKYSAIDTYGMFSPTDPDTLFFGAASQSTCQGIWVSHDGGSTILANPKCPYYTTKSFCDEYPSDPFCAEVNPRWACSGFYDGDVFFSVNPGGVEPYFFGFDLHGYQNIWGTYDPVYGTGQICTNGSMIEIPEGLFGLYGPVFFMNDGTIYAINPPFEIDCLLAPGGSCTSQCATGATTCQVPATLVKFSHFSGWNPIFEFVSYTDDISYPANIVKLGNFLLYTDYYHIKSFNLDPLDPEPFGQYTGVEGEWIFDFDAVWNSSTLCYDVYYIASYPDPADPAGDYTHAELRVLHLSPEGAELGRESHDFTECWTGVRNFFADEGNVYVGTWDRDKLFFSQDSGESFITLKSCPYSNCDYYFNPAIPSNFRYIEVEGISAPPKILSLFSGIAAAASIVSSPPAGQYPYFDGEFLVWFDWAFDKSNLCTTTFTSAAADPKVDPVTGELWLWLASDAGIWRNRRFHRSTDSELNSYVYPYWEHLSGGYGCGQTPCPEAPNEIPSTDFANYTFKIVFDKRDTTWKTVYAATKSGLWKGIEQETTHIMCGSTSAQDVYFNRVLNTGEEVRDVVVSGQYLYATTASGLHRSGDDTVWETVFLGPVTAVSAFENTPQKIVLATSSGLMFSEDSGDNWLPITLLQPEELPVKQLQARAVGGTDYVYYLTDSGYLKKSAAYDCTSFSDPPPQNLSAVATAWNGVEISWEPVEGAISYYLYRADGVSSPQLLATTLSSGFTDTSTMGSQTYSYSVRANFDEHCYTFTTGTVTVTTPPCVWALGEWLETPPTVAAGCEEVAVTWPEAASATSYSILRGSICSELSTIASGVPTTYYTDYTAVSGSVYFYAIQPASACGSGPAGVCSSDVTPLARPVPLVSGPSAGCDIVQLSTGSSSSYQWYINSAEIPGETGVTCAALATGSYSVKVTDPNGCFALSPDHPVEITPGTRTMHFQTESGLLAGFMDLQPFAEYEETAQEILTGDIVSPGEYQVGSSGTIWASPPFDYDTDISSRPWTFDVYGHSTDSGAAGQLYARVYSFRNGSPVLLFKTSFSDSDISSAPSLTRFTWSHTPQTGTFVSAGDRILAEFWVHATAGTSAWTDTSTASDYTKTWGNQQKTYAETSSCDSNRHLIREEKTLVASATAIEGYYTFTTIAGAPLFQFVGSFTGGSVYPVQLGFSIGSNTGPWTEMFEVSNTVENPCTSPLSFSLPDTGGLPVYVRVYHFNPSGGNETLSVNYMSLNVPHEAPAFAMEYDFAASDTAVTVANCQGTCAPPSAPMLENVTDTCDGPMLSWSADPASIGSYNVYRSTNTTCPPGTLARLNQDPLPASATTYSDTTTTVGATYTYVVRAACDLFGEIESRDSNCMSGRRLSAPGAPTAPVFTSMAPTSLQVNWADVDEATSYEVWRAAGPACTGAAMLASGVTGTSYADSGLSCETQYSYHVIATNTCGASLASQCRAVTTSTCGAPGEVVPVNWTADAAAINWPADPIATGYRVYRGSKSQLSWLLTSDLDSCTRFDGAALETPLDGPGDQPPAGTFLWFIVTAYKGPKEGSAGNATDGSRIVNSTGTCP